MNRPRSRPTDAAFQGGLTEAFLAGYHAALALVQAEQTLPREQTLNARELEIMLRRQCSHQLALWKQL